MQHRLLRRAGGALFAATLFLAACGEDDTTDTTVDDDSAATAIDASTSTVADEGEEPPPESTTAPAEMPEGTVIDVAVAGSDVEGGGRHQVAVGETVTIRVTSDVADHVHVHGYDLFADVAPGEPAEITFTADIPGVWEVELEDRHLPLLELQVQ